ncbi:hypothetical protein AB0J83_19985 [Actinoplanes sp. NPDC049596]|uniref:hypothetical protein n=1 Tax=unclassified Actinoplanes TaxID=2626549 RepID=UPI003444B702
MDVEDFWQFLERSGVRESNPQRRAGWLERRFPPYEPWPVAARRSGPTPSGLAGRI